MIRKILFAFCSTVYSFGIIQAQEFYPEISSERYTIEGSSREGYSTRFAYSEKEVEKGWWKYSREFGRPLNMKSYYKVTIPSGENSGNIDLVLLSKTIDTNPNSKFFLSLDQSNVPKEKLSAFGSQVKNILQSFKQSFYLERLEDDLETLEKKAKKWGKKVDKARGGNKDKALTELDRLEEEIEAIKEGIREIYSTY